MLTLVPETSRGTMEAATIPARPVAPPTRRSPQVIAGIVLATVAALFVLGGAGLLAVHLSERDSDGYFTSSPAHLTAPGYAIVSDKVDLTGLDDDAAAATARHLASRIRVAAESTNGKPVFVGIADQAAVDAYLHGVSRSTVTNAWDAGDATYRQSSGGAPRTAPGARHFWVASSTG